MGKDLLSGFQSLTAKYGQISGFWLGPRRAVVISNFEVLQDILNKPETADRQLRSAMRKKKIYLLTFQSGVENHKFFTNYGANHLLL